MFLVYLQVSKHIAGGKEKKEFKPLVFNCLTVQNEDRIPSNESLHKQIKITTKSKNSSLLVI